MSRIDNVFATAASAGELVLVAYLTAGYPSQEETVDLVTAAVEAGADVIELGVPFSDPIGDGAVIQASTQAALAAGMTLARTVDVVAHLRHLGITTPVALMGYCNPFLRYGLNRLFDAAGAVGVDAFVVPDLPAHEAGEWLQASSGRNIDTVFFASPGSRRERLKYTANRGSGFLYCLAADGVTGARDDLDPRLFDYLAQLRDVTALPLAVGFGISRREHVKALRGYADGVIVGSAIVQRIARAKDPEQRVSAVSELVAELKGACR